MHAGVHVAPLAKEEVHGLRTPFVGAVRAQGDGAVHLDVSVSVPAKHDLDPVEVYPVVHVGVQLEPLASDDVHGDADPPEMAPAAPTALNKSRTTSK